MTSANYDGVRPPSPEACSPADQSGPSDSCPTPCRLTAEKAAEHLEGSDEYRVLRRIAPREVVADRAQLPGRRIAIILDTETTGLNFRVDHVIEMAMIAFTYDDTGLLDVVGLYEGLQAPPTPLSRDIVRLTGLTDEMLDGKSIDAAEVSEFLSGAAVVIAHNAAFDRPFAEGVCPAFQKLPWACSLREVDWAELGMAGRTLGQILNGFGGFHDGHRAVLDCWALLEVLARDAPHGGPCALLRLLANARRTTIRFDALGAPFDSKDILKTRGYRWCSSSSRPRWRIEVPDHQADAETSFLKSEIYRGDFAGETRRITAQNRYRDPL